MIQFVKLNYHTSSRFCECSLEQQAWYFGDFRVVIFVESSIDSTKVLQNEIIVPKCTWYIQSCWHVEAA